MAEPNFDALADVAGRLQDELRNLGAMANGTGNAFEKAGSEAAKGLKDAAQSAVMFADATAKGAKGLTAYTAATSKAIDATVQLGLVLSTLIPVGRLVKGISAALAKLGFNLSDKAISVGLAGLGVGAMAAAEALKGAQRIVAEATDQIYKSYSGLAKSGAAAGEGMSGLIDDAARLGLSFEELEGFVRDVAQNSTALARFSGTVFDGRKRVAEIGEQLRGSRQQFLALGMSMEDVANATMGYMRIYGQLSSVQNSSVKEQTAAVKAYVLEQDLLTKLTGKTRQQLEDTQARAMAEEQFAGKLAELRNQGTTQADNAARNLLKLNAILSEFPDMAAAFRQAVTGNLTGPDATRLITTIPGALEVIGKAEKGLLTPIQAAEQLGLALDQFNRQAGAQLAQMRVNDQNFIKASEQMDMGFRARQGHYKNEEALARAQEEQGGREKTAKDKILADQVKLIDTQIAATAAMQNLIRQGIQPMQAASIFFAEKVRDSADFIAEKIYGISGGAGGFISQSGQRFEQGSGGVKPTTPNMAAGATQSARGGARSTARGMAPTGMTADEGVSKHGLRINTQDLSRPGAVYDPRFFEIAAEIQKALGGNFAGFSGFDDMYHRGRGAHGRGQALDLVLSKFPSPEEAKAITAMLAGIKGVKGVRDEYYNPSADATGQHMHVLLDVPAMAKGGITDGISIAGEAGPEAVVPLPDGKSIPVRLENDPLTEALRAFAELRSISELMEVRSGGPTTTISSDLAADTAMAQMMKKIWPEIQKGFESGALTVGQFRGMFGPADAEKVARAAFEKTKNVPMFGQGGITRGPSIAGEAGPEAVVPLPDGKSIPVSIENMPGWDATFGYNMGPISTDIEALKTIAGQLGAYDAATQTITDPNTWQEILKSGLLMNFNMAGAEFGTKMFGPEIGETLGSAVKEVMQENNVSSADAIKQVTGEFKSAMQTVIDTVRDKDYQTQQQMLEQLQNIARNQSRTADASQRMAQVAAN